MFETAVPYLIRARQCLIMHTVGRLKVRKRSSSEDLRWLPPLWATVVARQICVHRISLTLHYFTTPERPETTTTYSERHQVFDKFVAPLPFRISKVYYAGKRRGTRAFAYCAADVSRSPVLDVVDS
jgi:hypothetical protein